MNLNITKSNNGKIADKLGIDKLRKILLSSKVLNTINEMRLLDEQHNGDIGHDLCERYKSIASVCDTIEEYTYCMHKFIFFLANEGNLSTK